MKCELQKTNLQLGNDKEVICYFLTMISKPVNYKVVLW